MRLDHRKVLITGGGSGTGLAVARALAPTHDVGLPGARDLKPEPARAGTPSLRTLRLDVRSEDDARAAVEWMQSHVRGMDLLVHCAGVLKTSSDGGAETEQVEINLLGSIRMTRHALPLLRQTPEGAVVFLSSAMALGAAPGFAVYAATKAAVHSYARSLRAELAGAVRVFDVLPPWVDTEIGRGRGRSRLSPARVADAIVRALRRDQYDVPIGPIGALGVLARVSPSLADAILARELAAKP